MPGEMLAARELLLLDHIRQRGAIKSTLKSVNSSLGNIRNTDTVWSQIFQMHVMLYFCHK